jgi:hypothetical protein
MKELYLGQYTLDNTTQLMIPMVDDLICPISVQTNDLKLKTGEYFACGHGLHLWDTFDESLRALINERDSEQILKADSLMPLAI